MKAATAIVTLAAIIRKARCRYGSLPSEYETKSAPRAAAEPPNGTCVAVPSCKRKQHSRCISESHVRRHLASVEGGQDLPECPPTAVLTALRRFVNVPVRSELASFHVRSHRIFRCWPIGLDAMGARFKVHLSPGVEFLVCTTISSLLQTKHPSAGAVQGFPMSGP